MKKEKLPVSTKKVQFSYKNQEVLRDITVNIQKGTITAIIGKSGSGKSTFLQLVSGIINKKHRGKIRIFGLPRFFGRNKVGFVPQELAFIPDLSLEDNIKISGLNSGIKEETAVNRATELMKLLKFEESIKKKPTELSGGQKVRLNIILSLLHNPETIILDEPFVGLDFENRRLLWHFIESLKSEGKSVILTSHLLTETQEHVDAVIILKDGRIFFSGQIDELKKKLRIKLVLEVKLSRLSKEKMEKIRKYCIYHDIKIIDSYASHMMFALKTQKIKESLEKLFERNDLGYKVLTFREPTLDEVFLKA